MRLTLSIAIIAAALIGCGKTDTSSTQISVNTASTTPSATMQGEWKQGWGQGITEYTVEGSNKATLNISCTSESKDTDGAAKLLVSIDGKDYSSETSPINIIINGDKHSNPFDTMSRVGENNFEPFWNSLRKATKLQIEVDKKTVDFPTSKIETILPLYPSKDNPCYTAFSAEPAINQNGVSDKEKMANSVPADSNSETANAERIRRIVFRTDGAWVSKEDHAISNSCSEILRAKVDRQNDLAFFEKFSESEYEFRMFVGEKMRGVGMRDEVTRKPMKIFIDGNNMRIDTYSKNGLVKILFYKVFDNSIELYKLDCDNCDKAKFEDTLHFQQVKTRSQISEFCLGNY